MKSVYLFFILFATTIYGALAQNVALKTNLAYGGLTLTPNLSVEIGLGERTTLDVWAAVNPWKLEDYANKLAHFMGQAEIRYWVCERFNGLFVGVHGLVTKFNIAGYNLPWLLEPSSRDFQYQGYAFGGGVSVGYQFILARRWNLELNAAVGYARINYDKYEFNDRKQFVQRGHKDYFGPTRLGISIVFLIGRGK